MCRIGYRVLLRKRLENAHSVYTQNCKDAIHDKRLAFLQKIIAHDSESSDFRFMMLNDKL